MKNAAGDIDRWSLKQPSLGSFCFSGISLESNRTHAEHQPNSNRVAPAIHRWMNVALPTEHSADKVAQNPTLAPAFLAFRPALCQDFFPAVSTSRRHRSAAVVMDPDACVI